MLLGSLIMQEPLNTVQVTRQGETRHENLAGPHHSGEFFHFEASQKMSLWGEFLVSLASVIQIAMLAHLVSDDFVVHRLTNQVLLIGAQDDLST